MEALKKVLDPIFGIDLRSLALVRISLAFLILAELFIRSSFLFDLYKENGSLPPQSFIEPTWYTPWSWSIHLLFTGTPSLLILVFVLHICAALCLLVGYRTRVAAIVTWVLLVSLDHANPLMYSGWTLLLHLLLLISIFLPIGAVFSIDQARKFKKNDTLRVLSPWSAAFLIQMLCMYLFSILRKHEGSEWLAGNALYYVLSIDHSATSFGKLLLDLPQILPSLTFAVFYFEHAVPFLLISPYRTVLLRSVTLGLLVLMHLSFTMFLNIGLFSFVSMAGLIAFVPSEIWERVISRLKKKFGGIQIYYDGDCGFCRRSVWLIYVFFALPKSSVGKAQEEPSIFADMQKNDSWVVVGRDKSRHFGFEAMVVILTASPLFFFLAPLGKIGFIATFGEKVYRFVAKHRPHVCLPERTNKKPSDLHSKTSLTLGFIYIFLIIGWNVASFSESISLFRIPNNVQKVATALGVNQSWRLFNGADIKDNSWYVIPGTLENGDLVDIYRNGAPLSFERRSSKEKIYKSEQWRKYLTKIRELENQAYRIQYAKLLCNKWNREHETPKKLLALELGTMNIPIPPPGEPLPKPGYINLLSWKCGQP